MTAQIEYLGRPATIYRYRSIQDPVRLDQEIEALIEGYIWGARFNVLNDPMDGDFSHNAGLRRVSGGKDYIRQVRNEISKLGISAFCEIDNHTLMWAHYADQFRGICVGYDFSKLRDELDDDIVFTRIFYSDAITNLTKVRTDPAYTAKRVLSRKTRGWLYEREWRMISPSEGKHRYKSNKVVEEVLLGPNMGLATRMKIRRALKPLGIKTRSLALDRLVASL